MHEGPGQPSMPSIGQIDTSLAGSNGQFAQLATGAFVDLSRHNLVRGHSVGRDRLGGMDGGGNIDTSGGTGGGFFLDGNSGIDGKFDHSNKRIEISVPRKVIAFIWDHQLLPVSQGPYASVCGLCLLLSPSFAFCVLSCSCDA